MLHRTRRIFGGKEGRNTTAGESLTYARPLENQGDQAIAETLAVGTTYRVFPGPCPGGHAWSYHVSPVSAAGATSKLEFFYSNLPKPDPTNADHWVESGVSDIALDATTDAFGTVITEAPAWIMAKATVVDTTGTVWAYVRTLEDE